MPQFLPVSWPFALSALVALQASAQVNVPAATPVPVTPNGAKAQAVPAYLTYRSVFEGYQPFTDEKLKPWRESNSTVEKIGGWRAYAKEAAEPEAKGSEAPTAPPAAAPKPPAASTDPHAGHGKH